MYEFGMRNALIRRQQVVVKRLASVNTGEAAGFSDRNKELLASCGVDDQVVDGFVWYWAFALVLG